MPLSIATILPTSFLGRFTRLLTRSSGVTLKGEAARSHRPFHMAARHALAPYGKSTFMRESTSNVFAKTKNLKRFYITGVITGRLWYNSPDERTRYTQSLFRFFQKTRTCRDSAGALGATRRSNDPVHRKWHAADDSLSARRDAS